MEKFILTDVDDVLVNWSDPFEQWVRSNYPEFRDIPDHLTSHWNIEEWLKCDIEVSRALIKQFNGNDIYWRNFSAKEGAVEAVRHLTDLGYNFVAITAAPTDHNSYDGRRENLTNLFGNAIDTLHCVGLSQPKTKILSRYRPTFWIEDTFRHAMSGVELGHKSILINYAHNANHHDDRIIRVDTWEEITKIILAPE